MKCPYCVKGKSKVVDKRDIPEFDSIRRRRECLNCGKRYTTYERIELTGLSVIKKDGKRESFNRDKLLAGVLKSCEKRPIPREEVEKLVNEVEANLRTHEEKEIPSTEIGKHVMKRLKDLDNVAYIRFASVYREFTDLRSFEKELTKLRKSLEKRKSKHE